MNFCPSCGTKIEGGPNFCSNCGHRLRQEDPAQKPKSPRTQTQSRPATGAPSASRSPSPESGSILVRAFDRRTQPGQLTDAYARQDETLVEALSDAWLQKDSEEAKHAGCDFDPNSVPGPRDWIPCDCVWAYAPHPGPLPRLKGKSLQQRFAEMGVLRGLTLAEIEAAVGPPSSRFSIGDETTATWQSSAFKAGLFTASSSMFSLTLLFDKYNICAGVQSEMNL